MSVTRSSASAEPDHSKAALRLWLRLLACESMLEQQVRSKLREEFKITLPQFDVLAELDHVEKPLTMSELSKQLMVSNGNITGVVDRLVRDNFVERLPSHKDRRVQLIALSEKGRSEFKLMALKHEHWIADAFDALNIEDMHEMTTLLNRAGEKLKAKFWKSTS